MFRRKRLKIEVFVIGACVLRITKRERKIIAAETWVLNSAGGFDYTVLKEVDR